MMFDTRCLRWFRPKVQPGRCTRERRPRPRKNYSRPEVVCLEDRCLPSVTLGTNFAGVDFPGSRGIPPDTQVATGPNHLVEVVNSQIAIYNKAGTQLSSQSLSSFFNSSFPIPLQPVVMYDDLANRFVVGALQEDDSTQASVFDLAVSNSSDPTLGFTEIQRFNIQQTTSSGQQLVADFPRSGWNADAYVFTFNMFSLSGATNTYDHTQLLTLTKSSLLDANPSTWNGSAFNLSFPLTPAVMHGSAAGDPMWFVESSATGGNSVQVTRMTNVLGTPQFASFRFNFTSSYAIPPKAPQPGSSGLIDTGNTGILSASLRGSRLVATQDVGTGGVAHARWYEFNISSGGATLTQSGEINPGAGVYTYFPSIDIAANGDLGMTYLESSPNEFLSMYITGRTSADPLTTMETPVLVKAGQAAYNDGFGNPSLAGYYSGISVDPVLSTTFWAANQFATNASPANWGTWIANFSLTSQPGGSSTTVISSPNPAVFGQTVTFTATVSATAPSTGTPTGTITIRDGTTTLGTAILSNGTATFTTSSLTVGSHAITVVYGGDTNFLSSTSAILPQSVNQATTTTSVVSSANPSGLGQAVTFTATVMAVTSAAGTPTGTVTFRDGTTTLGQALLNASGVATFPTASLTFGAHTITAVYGGDPSFSGSTSTALLQTVGQAASTTAVTSSLNPSVFGQPVSFTATVTPVAPATGLPTGTVTFRDGPTILGTASLSNGTATFTTTLSVGNHAITVIYSGDATFTTSTSSVLTQTVNQASSVTAVASSANPSGLGQAVTFRATVSATAANLGPPTGTVTFFDGTANLGTATLSLGTATFTTATLNVGSHALTVSYVGDANFASSTSTTLTQTVNQAATTTTLVSSANPSGLGQAVTFTATVSALAPSVGTPTGTITYRDNGATLGTATLANGMATLTTAALTLGSHSIIVSYGGDSNFTPSTSAALAQTVNPTSNTTTTVVTSSLNPSTFGQVVTFTVTVSPLSSFSGTPTGTVSFLLDGTSQGALALSNGQAALSLSLSVGTHTAVAIYSGDSLFTPTTSAPLTQTVDRANTTTTVVSSVNPSVLGQAVSFTATARTLAPGAGIPTGTVTFQDGGTSLGAATLSNGTATLATAILTGGSHAISVVYGGDANFTSSTSAPLTQTVNAQRPAVTLGTNFAGLDYPNSGLWVPPSAQIAAGPNHLVEVVNSQIAIYNKAGALLFSQPLSSFFSFGFPTPVEPVVIYDDLANRFVVGALQKDNNTLASFLDLAISDSSDPTLGFKETQIINVQQTTSTGQMLVPDSPRLGWNADAYVVTLNMFAPISSPLRYDHTQVLPIAKAPLLDANYRTFTPPLQLSLANQPSLVGTAMHGSVAGDPMWFVRSADQGGNFVQVTRMTNVLGSSPVFTPFPAIILSSSYAVPPKAPQRGSSGLIDTFNARILDASLRGNRLVATHTVGIGGVAHARWYDIDLSGTAPTLTQSGEINPGAGVYTYYPSIEIAANGDLGMTYLESSTSEFLSMYITGRTSADSPSTMETPVLAQGGQRDYTDFTGTYRAGSYSGISVDPVSTSTFWAANEFATNASSNNWGTWIASFRLASGGSGATPGPIVASDDDELADLVPLLDPLPRALADTDTRNGAAENLAHAGASAPPAIPPLSEGLRADRQPARDLDRELVDGVFASRSRRQPSGWLERSWNADALLDSEWTGIWSDRILSSIFDAASVTPLTKQKL